VIPTYEERCVKIDLLLRKLHIMSMNPSERLRMAQGLAQQNLLEVQVRMVWDECRACSSNDEQARGLFVTTIREPLRVVSIYEDLQEKQDRQRGTTQNSEMRFVSEANPYGWSDPDRIIHEDHSIPGEWNPFRQCYNLTQEETTKLKRTDPRRHGCSRFEAIGDKTAPDHDWNGDLAKLVTDAGASNRGDRVYGE